MPMTPILLYIAVMIVLPGKYGLGLMPAGKANNRKQEGSKLWLMPKSKDWEEEVVPCLKRTRDMLASQ